MKVHALTILAVLLATSAFAADPLPSWNDGAAKRSITAFVEKVTKEGSPDFVPEAERIATFDNDGTLWCEKPLPVQLFFALDRVKALAPGQPAWKHDDAGREYAYDRADHLPRLAPGLDEAAAEDRTVASMKQDWKTVFSTMQTEITTQPEITAIDILLQPDATMLKHSAANNIRLLKVFPQGFPLDAAHTPHITMLQCFVRTADLEKVYAAQEKVLAAANVNAMKLEADKFYYAPGGALGVAGICAKPTPDILKLQADIIAAAKPFMVNTGPISAFTAPHADPAMDAALIDYVSTFVPKMSGENFNPHVSTGVAPKEYLDRMLAEPFEKFTFSPAGAAIYQLGPFGTAAKKLKEWDLKR